MLKTTELNIAVGVAKLGAGGIISLPFDPQGLRHPTQRRSESR
ncbi:hypothetical protein RMSM_04287 [Rhodopirellula maiorica SM1]|uniref:Uncharacterized protein n=1 Tax=Rhodopirellula maiorica SM1 TaxID=1265738 RepID=M5RTQ8_9BACT|nr:hypothetical protein RMSM_04287 [Rhodopirellula maiorica SM1]